MLREELTQDPAGLGYVLANHAQLEATINARTRTRLRPTEMGKGDAISVLGLQVGNALCDVLDTAAEFRHVRHLLAAGRLRLDLPISQGSLAAMVGAEIAPGITFEAAHLQALNALALEPCSRAEELGLPYVTDAMIREALA